MILEASFFMSHIPNLGKQDKNHDTVNSGVFHPPQRIVILKCLMEMRGFLFPSIYNSFNFFFNGRWEEPMTDQNYFDKKIFKIKLFLVSYWQVESWCL